MPVLGSVIFSSIPGNGKPTVPARLSALYGLDVLIFVSVMPYRSKILWPVRFSKSICVSANSGALPEINNRIFSHNLLLKLSLDKRRV